MNRCLLILSLLCSAWRSMHKRHVLERPQLPHPPSREWPVQDGVFDMANFRFHDGETLPTTICTT